jgi:hypothetical protein
LAQAAKNPVEVGSGPESFGSDPPTERRGAISNVERAATREVTLAATHDAMLEAIRDAMPVVIHGATPEATHGAMPEAIHGAMPAATHDATPEATQGAATREVMLAVTHGATPEATHGAATREVMPAVTHDATLAVIRDLIPVAIHDVTLAATRDVKHVVIHDEMLAATRDVICAVTRDATRAVTRDATPVVIRDATPVVIRDATRAASQCGTWRNPSCVGAGRDAVRPRVAGCGSSDRGQRAAVGGGPIAAANGFAVKREGRAARNDRFRRATAAFKPRLAPVVAAGRLRKAKRRASDFRDPGKQRVSTHRAKLAPERERLGWRPSKPRRTIQRPKPR